jgi:hypothetical protein
VLLKIPSAYPLLPLRTKISSQANLFHTQVFLCLALFDGTRSGTAVEELPQYCQRVSNLLECRCVSAPNRLINTPWICALESVFLCLCHKDVGFCNERAPRTRGSIAHQLLYCYVTFFAFNIMGYAIETNKQTNPFEQYKLTIIQ